MGNRIVSLLVLALTVLAVYNAAPLVLIFANLFHN